MEKSDKKEKSIIQRLRIQGRGVPPKTLFRLILLFVIMIAGYIALYIKTWNDSHNELRIEINEKNPTSYYLDITVDVVKFWDDVDSEGKACVGAQYDILVKNKMNATFSDWQMLITLPRDARIDSSWNGEFITTGREIIFKPEYELDIYAVKPDAVESFGMVLYSESLLKINEFLIVGYRDAHITDYIGFYIWLVYAAFVIVGIIGYAVIKGRIYKLEQQRINDEKIIMETMQVIADFVDAKDEYTKGHSSRVASYSRKLARKLKMSDDEVKHIGYIALMHDCGKMGIPDNVLNKPGRLNEEETRIMQTHTVLGGKVLRSITALEGIREGALYHHERYDGKGYPEGLSGEDIPLCARIICVADSFDAMNSDRCYRKHLEKDEIIKELKDNMGKQFDPELAKHMIKMLKNGEV